MRELKRRRIIRIGDIVVFEKGYYSYDNYVQGIFEFNIVPLIFSKGELPFLKKRLKPRVGFVGYAASPIRALLSRLFHLVVKKPCEKGDVSTVQHRAMKCLKRTSDIACNFILRSTFWGTLQNTPTRAEQRNEFIQNIEENDYILCARGGGNFSFRFYETLCSGRIPLFINTDCVLPFENKIDWKKYVVWVEEEDIGHIDAILRSFHECLDDREYQLR